MDLDRRLLNLVDPVSPVEGHGSPGSPPLRTLLESDAYRASHAMLPIVVGADVGGLACVADIAALPHLLVGGRPRSGKTTFVRAVIAALLARFGPGDVGLFLFSADPAGFHACDGLPHLLAAPSSDPHVATSFLTWARLEMDRRYGVLRDAGVRHVERLNRRPPLLDLIETSLPGGVQLPRLPYVVAIFDGLRALAGRWDVDVLAATVALCQMSRAVGIHLIMATDDLSVAALPGHLNVNLTARLSFAQARGMDSSILLYARGAEALEGAGEALFLRRAAPLPLSLRTPWVSEEALARVVAARRGMEG